MIFVQAEEGPVEVVTNGPDGERVDRIEPGAMRAIELPAEGDVAFSIRLVDPTPVEEQLLGDS